MSKVYFSATVNQDGSLTVPAFAMRGMGHSPEDTVHIATPTNIPDCGFECFTDELFIGRCCSDTICSGYTSDGEDVNIPAKLFADAGVPAGSEVTILAGDGALVLVAGTGDAAGLPEAITELLVDLGLEVDTNISLDKQF